MPPINISTSGGFFRWQPACWLRVHGPDAAVFLQGQFTNDLRALERQSAVYGLWLSVKGKVVGDSFVMRAGPADSFWVGSYASPAAAISERLEHHIIADDVAIEDHTAEWAGVSLFGDAAGAFLGRGNPDGVVFPGRRARQAQLDCVFQADAAERRMDELRRWPELPPESVTTIRIRDRIPLIPVDIGPGDLPNEGGLEADALSYTKGCYLGQEVMARLKSMGQVRRRLLRVRGEGAVPPLPAALFTAGRQVGELRSAAAEGPDQFVGLAMLSLLAVNPDSRLAFPGDAAPRVSLLDTP